MFTTRAHCGKPLKRFCPSKRFDHPAKAQSMQLTRPDRGVYAASMCKCKGWQRIYLSAPFSEDLDAAKTPRSDPSMCAHPVPRRIDWALAGC